MNQSSTKPTSCINPTLFPIEEKEMYSEEEMYTHRHVVIHFVEGEDPLPTIHHLREKGWFIPIIHVDGPDFESARRLKEELEADGHFVEGIQEGVGTRRMGTESNNPYVMAKIEREHFRNGLEARKKALYDKFKEEEANLEKERVEGTNAIMAKYGFVWDDKHFDHVKAEVRTLE